MTVDVVYLGVGALFAAGGVFDLAAATSALRAGRAFDAAMWALFLIACIYLASHAFLAALPIA